MHKNIMAVTLQYILMCTNSGLFTTCSNSFLHCHRASANTDLLLQYKEVRGTHDIHSEMNSITRSHTILSGQICGINPWPQNACTEIEVLNL